MSGTDAATPGPSTVSAPRSGASFPAMRAAKVPRAIVAGPYGHPFHPVAVTIPIGAWSSSLVFDLLGLAADDPRGFAQGSRWLIAIGLGGAVGASVLGLLDMSRIPKGTPAHRTALARTRSERASRPQPEAVHGTPGAMASGVLPGLVSAGGAAGCATSPRSPRRGRAAG